MIKRFLFVLLVLITYTTQSAIYYVSSTGSDSANGLTTGTAWQTLTKVNATTFLAGDQILFKKGDIFYGSLTVNQSGSLGNPITFGAYGTGANPIITGYTTVSAWTNLGSNIWESTNAVSTLSTCNVVLVNGVLTPMGRYPNLNDANGGYLKIQSWTNLSITNSALTGIPDWTGAECVTRTHNTRLDRTLISSQSGSTLNLARDNGGYITNFGFFIQNDSRTLDVQNEWYYNPTNKKIRIYSTSQPTDVKVASVENLVVFDRVSYVTFENIAFEVANKNIFNRWVGGDSQRSNYTIRNCSMYFAGGSAIVSHDVNIVNIENNSIYYCNGTAISISNNDHLVVKNNDIRHNGIIKGADLDGGAYSAIGFANGCLKVNVENNQIVDTGNNGITFDGDSILIKNNYVDTFNQTIDDGAGITGGGRANNAVNTGNTVTGNIVINGIGANVGTSSLETTGGQSEGIYTADNITYLTISNNSIANIANNGIYATFCDHVYVTGNTVYNCGAQQILFKVQNQLTNDRTVSGNIFVAKTLLQLAAQYTYVTSISGSFSSLTNNIYARPIADTYTIREWNGVGSATNKTIDEWKIFSSMDTNSKKSPISVSSVNDIQFVYNETNAVKVVSLNNPSIDMVSTANKYVGSVTLQPYTSVIYLKDPNPATIAPAGKRHPVKSGTKYYKSNGYYYTL